MNIFTEIFKSMVPVRLEAMWGAVVGAFGILASHIWGACLRCARFREITGRTGVERRNNKTSQMKGAKHK